MFRLEGGRPGDVRGFVHKRLLGLGQKFLGSGVGSFISTLVKSPARPTLPREQTARPTFAGAGGKEFGRSLKFGEGPGLATTVAVPRAFAPGVECRPPSRINPDTGRCEVPTPGFRAGLQRLLPGGETGFGPAPRTRVGPVGDAVMGQFGAALEPGVMMIERSVCLKGMQLAKDGLCYNKGAITNKQRMWPRGRRPLLTGGDMRAIAIAHRAGTKLDSTTTRLRELGMMRQLPKPRRSKAHQHAKPVAAVSV